MNPKQKQLLAAVLGAAVILVWIRALGGRPARRASSILPAAQTAPQEPVVSPRQTPSADWGENPFMANRQPAASGSASAAEMESDLVLNGILWDSKNPSAVVNNQVVGVGDPLGPWKVVEILKDRVILSDGASTQTLTVD